jgi:cell division GTPase FtsZ
MNEINEVARLIAEAADPAAKIIFGAYHDRRLKDKELKVVLIATGFNGSRGAGSLFSATPFDSLIPKGNGGRENKDQKAMKEAAPVATLASTELKEEKNEAKEKKDKGDIFDIPTFLRRKR